MDFMPEVDFLKGVTALKKPVTCQTVLNLQRRKKSSIEKGCGWLVGEEKHLAIWQLSNGLQKSCSFTSSMKFLDGTGQGTK